MRLNLRLKFRNITFFVMLAHYQTLYGATNKVDKDHYLVFWDLEGGTLEEVLRELTFIQKRYSLGKIYIMNDETPKSFRAWCFSQVDFKTYLKILLDTNYVDWNFFYWTVRRGSATLRLSRKKGRKGQKIVAIIKGYEYPIPSKIRRVKYDTGVEKKGLWVKN